MVAPEHRRVHDAEELLPQEWADGGDHADDQYGTERHPHGSKAVELSDNHQGGEGEQGPELQAAEEESHCGQEHRDQAAEHPHAQADPRLGLRPQLDVQHRLRVVQEEDGRGAEHEAREEHHHLEAAVSWDVD